MKKLILSTILMIALSISLMSCREAKDKALDAAEETNEVLMEIGEDMKKAGTEALDKASAAADSIKKVLEEAGEDVKDGAIKTADKAKAAADTVKEKIEE